VKNQYFADQNDYFKYDLLISLAKQLTVKKLSVVWMLTPDDGSHDGGKVTYSRGASDSGLYQFLQKSLHDGTRNVARIDDYFKGAGHDLDYCSYGDSETFCQSDRATYFKGIPKANLDDAVIFLDPDNGLEVQSKGKTNGDKYVKLNEVELIYNKMGKSSILVIYQHLPHVHRKFFLYSTYSKLIEKLKCPMPVSISDNTIAFIILAKDKNRQKEVRQALHEYTRSHLEIYD
jgi:hypothetical protein